MSVTNEEREETPKLYDVDPLPQAGGSEARRTEAYTAGAVDQDPYGVATLVAAAADTAGKSEDELLEEFDADLRFMVGGASRFVAVQRAPGFAPSVAEAAAASPGAGGPMEAAGGLLRLFDATASRALPVSSPKAGPVLSGLSPPRQVNTAPVVPETIDIDEDTI